MPCPGSLQLGTAQPSCNEKKTSARKYSEGFSSPLLSGSRPYPCPACGKTFSLKHQMESPYRVHTGEKPFSCHLCSQRSRDFSAMTKHLRTHGAASYRCPLCQAGSPNVAAMQVQIQGHPPGQLPPGWTIQSTFLYSSSRPSPSSCHCRVTPPSSSSPCPLRSAT